MVAAFVGPLADLIGADGETHALAVTYLRIASIGLAFAFLALGGSGYLRGVDLRLPLLIDPGNVASEVLFVYGFDWGIAARRGDGPRADRDGRGVPRRDRAPRVRPETWRPVLALIERLVSLGK